MYVQGFVIPVPEGNKDAYREVARKFWDIAKDYGAAGIGALASPHSTVEELFLLQKLVRGLGSENVDFRLRQADFRADGKRAGVPWLGMPIAGVKDLTRLLVVGSFLRKDAPLLAQRVRQATKKGLHVSAIGPNAEEWLLPVRNRALVAPSAMVAMMAQVVAALAQEKAADVSVALVGRWALGLLRGQWAHADIARSPARPGEVRMGWAFHVLIGGGGVALLYAVWLQAAGGRPSDALAWGADGLSAKTWAELPAALARGDWSTLAGWPAAQQLELLQKLCHDLMAQAAGGTPRFFTAANLPVAPRWGVLARWSRELLDAARSVEHPYNPGLMQEAWAARTRQALVSR